MTAQARIVAGIGDAGRPCACQGLDRPGSSIPATTASRFSRPFLFAAFAFCVTVCSITHAQLPRDSDYDYEPPKPGTYTLPVIKFAADGVLLDAKNKPVTLSELTRGRVTILSFIYTRCAAPKGCPYATGVLGQLHDLSAKDPALAKNMQLLSISFDPDYDTPARLATYAGDVREESSGCPWRFLTGRSRADLEPILAAYNQAVDQRANPSDPQGPLYHTLRVFLIDQKGRIRNIYSSGTLDVRLLLADVRTLLLEKS